ncbi:hypothetical protein [Pendulispora albinea]|uniref:MalT-like TPR region domain-containing protein n=1 Tax=Pendulispora albinea TaxID=2741071 RepID=A0ABZ2LRW2_9BACT
MKIRLAYDIVREFRRFILHPEMRLFHVTVPELAVFDKVEALLQILGALEENAWHTYRLATGHTSRDPGWAERLRRLDAMYGELRRYKVHRHQAPLGPAPDVGDPLEAFAQRLGEIAQKTIAPAEGVVVLLEPTIMEGEALWQSAIARLMEDAALKRARLVVLDPVHPSLGELPARRSDRAMALFAHVGAGDVQAAIDRVLAREVRRVPDGRGPAWVERRRNDERRYEFSRGALADVPEEAANADATEVLRAGTAAEGSSLFDSVMGRLATDSVLRHEPCHEARTALERATESFVRGDVETSLTMHEELLRRHGSHLSEQDKLVLAGERARCLIALGETPNAIDLLVSTAERGEKLSLGAPVAALYASIGALHGGTEDFQRSARAYARASRIYAAAADVRMAVHTARSQGHAALNAGDPVQALAAWRDALHHLGRTEPRSEDQPLPMQVIELARALAAALEQWGDAQGAAALMGHANAIHQNFRTRAPKSARRFEN